MKVKANDIEELELAYADAAQVQFGIMRKFMQQCQDEAGNNCQIPAESERSFKVLSEGYVQADEDPYADIGHRNPSQVLESPWDKALEDRSEDESDYIDDLVYGALNPIPSVVTESIKSIVRWFSYPEEVKITAKHTAAFLVPCADEDTVVDDFTVPLVHYRVARRFARNARVDINCEVDDRATRLIVKEHVRNKMIASHMRYKDISCILPLVVSLAMIPTSDEEFSETVEMTREYRDAVIRRDNGLFAREAPTLWNWFGRKIAPSPRPRA